MFNNAQTVIQNRKDTYWQYIRGICILCVILIHCKNGVEYKEIPGSSWNFDYWLIVRQIINFPVAIFIFLSGYFTNIKKVEQDKITYIYSRGGGGRLLIPYLVWSTFYTFANIFMSKGSVSGFKIAMKVLLGLSVAHLYYILVLLQLTVITPFLTHAIQTKKRSKMLFLITPIYLLILYGYSAIFKQQLLFYQTFFPAWFIFYYAGLWVKIRGFDSLFKRSSLEKSILYCSLALAMSIGEGYVLLKLGFSPGFASSQIKISSFIYVFTLINLLINVRPYFDKRRNSGISIIGDYSYGIYYIHMVWIIISNKFLMNMSFISNVLPLYHFIQGLFTVTFSLISIFVTRKILGRKASKKLLGF